MITVQAGTQALMPNIYTYVTASGGTPPYAYSVAPNGAGGAVDPVTGLYIAPPQINVDAHLTKYADTVIATDALNQTGQVSILVGPVFLLLCDIIKNELSLTQDQVYVWDQKLGTPIDSRMYVAVSVVSCKPFGNSIKPDPTLGWSNAIQSLNMYALLGIDVLSRGPEARDRKEEVVMALKSIYSQSQQEINGFHLGTIPSNFVALNEIQGSAIPYRFNMSLGVQYQITKSKAVPYYDTFATETITTES